MLHSNIDEANKYYNECAKMIDRGVTKGIYTKNYGNRKKSQLAKIRDTK